MTSSLHWEHYDRGAHTEPKRFQIDEADDGCWLACDYATGEVRKGMASRDEAVAWCEGRMWGEAEPDVIMGGE